MMHRTRIILKGVFAVVLIIIGLAALLTPLTPGSWLILVGAEILGIHVLFPKRIQHWIDKMKSKLIFFRKKR